MFALLVAYALVDTATHLDDGSAGWRLWSSAMPATVCGAVALLSMQPAVDKKWSGALFVFPILALQVSVYFTVRQTANQADIGSMIVLLVLLGAIAVSNREYFAMFAAVVALTVLGLFSLDMPSDASIQPWLMVVAVAAVGSMNLHFARMRGLSHLADVQIELTIAANEDAATGLSTRSHLERAFPTMRAQAERLRLPMFAVFVDVDGLKRVNDTMGHEVGDAVIGVVAEELRRLSRQSDLVVRWGGDEFVVVGIGDGPHLDRLEAMLADDIRGRNPAPSEWAGVVSMGKAHTAAVGCDLAAMVSSADADMYSRRRLRRIASTR